MEGAAEQREYFGMPLKSPGSKGAGLLSRVSCVIFPGNLNRIVRASEGCQKKPKPPHPRPTSPRVRENPAIAPSIRNPATNPPMCAQ